MGWVHNVAAPGDLWWANVDYYMTGSTRATDAASPRRHARTTPIRSRGSGPAAVAIQSATPSTPALKAKRPVSCTERLYTSASPAASTVRTPTIPSDSTVSPASLR